MKYLVILLSLAGCGKVVIHDHETCYIENGDTLLVHHLVCPEIELKSSSLRYVPK